ncbi:hypothetical protein Efla_003207 [Eimeria flavescens]
MLCPRRFVYEGEWHQGVPNGWGVLRCADGSEYHGEWASGQRHGFGEQTFPNGSRYEGQWVNGNQEGRGRMSWKNPEVHYIGEWRGGKQSGWGRQTWIEHPDADRETTWTVGRNLQQNQYEGYFKDGRREGVGAFSYSNGARYEGGWVADKKHGLGKYKSESGALYEGLFLNDRMAEKPPASPDDPLQALVDLSQVQQVEVYRQLEACSKPDVWNQLPACERAAARTVRSIFHTMLRNICMLRRVYAAYRRFAPMPHSDPYILSCAQFWCLAFDADLLSSSLTLCDTAKIFFNFGKDETFQKARRLSGGMPASMTVIEAERRRSTLSCERSVSELREGLHIFGDVLETQIDRHLRGETAEHEQASTEHAQDQPSVDTDPITGTKVQYPAVEANLSEENPPHAPAAPLRKKERHSGAAAKDPIRQPSREGLARQTVQNKPFIKHSPVSQVALQGARGLTQQSEAMGGRNAAGASATRLESLDLDSQGDPSAHSKEAGALAVDAGRHAHSFGQAALAETLCILNDSVHKALFSESGAGKDLSTGICGAEVCSTRSMLRLLDFHLLVLLSAGSPAAATPTSTRSRRNSCGVSIPSQRPGSCRGRLSRSQNIARMWFHPTACVEAKVLLAVTSLKTFALPALTILALIQEVFPDQRDAQGSNICQTAHQHHQQESCEGQEQINSGQVLPCPAGDNDAVNTQQADHCVIHQKQQKQQLEWLKVEKKHKALEEELRRKAVSWSELAARPLTLLEFQRLLLRLVQLKMPPMIAALLPLGQQVEGFLRLLSAAASSLGSIQQPSRHVLHLLPLCGPFDPQDQHPATHQGFPPADDSPTAHSDTSFATAVTGVATENTKCFWKGFFTSGLARQVCDESLLIEDDSDFVDSESESSGSEAGVEPAPQL